MNELLLAIAYAESNASTEHKPALQLVFPPNESLTEAIQVNDEFVSLKK